MPNIFFYLFSSIKISFLKILKPRHEPSHTNNLQKGGHPLFLFIYRLYFRFLSQKNVEDFCLETSTKSISISTKKKKQVGQNV